MLPVLLRPKSGYLSKVLSTTPIAYWPLNETSGSVAKNHGSLGAAANGTYSGPTLNQTVAPGGTPAPLFDGINDFVNIYSAALAAAFNPGLGSLSIWLNLNAAVPFAASFRLAADDSNVLSLLGRDPSNGDVVASYFPSVTSYSVMNTDYNLWFHAAFTWDFATTEFKVYLNGSYLEALTMQEWVGALSPTMCTIGAYTSAPMLLWTGYLAHTAVWDKVLTPAQIAMLYNGGL